MVLCEDDEHESEKYDDEDYIHSDRSDAGSYFASESDE